MLFSYNSYHHTVYSSVATEVTGKINNQYSNVEYYFRLKKTNDSLIKANALLYNKLKQDYEIPDTASRLSIDTIKIDTIFQQRKFMYLPAKVVGNSVNQINNYVQVHRGSQQGITIDLGVTDINNAVVGTVIDVSKNYSVVMSLLHRQSNISAKLKKTGETGSVVWDGLEANVVVLKEISKDVKVNKGDTVITSGFSDKFPYGLMIGTVLGVYNDKTTTTHIIKVKTAANFYNLEYVNIINNLQKDEPAQLLKGVKKINE